MIDFFEVVGFGNVVYDDVEDDWGYDYGDQFEEGVVQDFEFDSEIWDCYVQDDVEYQCCENLGKE